MIKVLFATGNESKLKRFSQGLKEKGIEVLSLKDISCDIEVEENGQNAIENALIKARTYSKIVDIPVFAMDDNLYLENVPEDKQPGMYVRRVHGKRLNDQEMIEHYIDLVKTYGQNGKLNCKWVYGMAVICNGEESTYTWDKDDLYLVNKPSKKVNPGYPINSISISKVLNKYFTEITEEDKLLLQEEESDVFEFLVHSILDSK